MNDDNMRSIDWLNGIRAGWVPGFLRKGPFRRRKVEPRFETLESRLVLAEDFGDAPDTGAGTGRGNYQTRLSDNGPRHTGGNFIGLGFTDTEADATPNSQANGDDVGSDDENGVLDPLADLVLTVGAQPRVNLSAFNQTASMATLSGWIDYNADGVFDNATERAQVTVPVGSATNHTLVFPVVPSGFTGTTYARFRLSTDAAATNPTGLAADGEVEDYAVTILGTSNSTVKTGGATKIASGMNGGPVLANYDQFGSAVTNLGDIDGDGVTDLAVGAQYDDTNGTNRGAVYVLRMNSNGTVKGSTKIASGTNGGPTLANYDFFGTSVAGLGDIDGDGVGDVAVGAGGDDYGGPSRGAVHILRLNSDGTVKGRGKFGHAGFGPTTVELANGDFFGSSLANIGDVDCDGEVDLAVGAVGDDTGGGNNRGAIYIVRRITQFTPIVMAKIAHQSNGGPTLTNDDRFGGSVAGLGDIDGDGVVDLAVGAVGDDTGESPNAVNRGAVHILKLNRDGTARTTTKIASGLNGGPSLVDNRRFGASVGNGGDLDGDGVSELIVGETRRSSTTNYQGAIHILRLNAAGSVQSSTLIENQSGGLVLAENDYFGSSVASLGDLDGDGVTDLAVGAYKDDTGGGNNSWRGAVHILRLNAGSPLRDFGDAPDATNGTGAGNYQTRNADSGPSHGIVTGLLLGTRISGEADATANARSNGDDIGIDDEDGVINPQVDFVLTIGTQPTIALRATNTTGTAATLSGWIDFNNNGVFDNASERAQIAVPSGTNGGVFNLTFPVVPAGFTGGTFARFRMSTDVAAASPTGSASNGEVEDYAVTMTRPSDGTVESAGARAIVHITNGGPSLVDGDRLGSAVAALGDFDGDGIGDVATGAIGDDTNGPDRGAIYIQLLNPNGSVKSNTKIASGTNGGPALPNGADFGIGIANLGDLDGDGVIDLAVGAHKETGEQGSVYILFLNSNGTVKSSTRIAAGVNGGPSLLANSDRFGTSVASLGDLNGDGQVELAVGAFLDDTDGVNRGAIYILSLRSNGTAASSRKLASGSSGVPSLANEARWGRSLANMGDLDGDGFTDLAVGAPRDQGGSVTILRLNSDGSIKSNTSLSSGVNGVPTFTSNYFSSAVANAGDLDGDGLTDLLVGDYGDGTGGGLRGAVHVWRLRGDGTVKSASKLSHGGANLPALMDFDYFGFSVANLGDLDGDGVTDLAVGANGDDRGGPLRGAVHVLRLNLLPNAAPTGLSLSANTIAENSSSGTVIGTLSTTDPDVGNTFTYSLVAGTGSTDNASFTIVGNQVQSSAVFDFEAKSSYAIRVRTTDQGNLSFEQTFTINVTNGNDAPTLDASGSPFAILGVGSRQSTEMRQGTLVSDILARAANGNPIADVDAGAKRGIAVIATDTRFGTYQFTLVTNNPQESDWQALDGNISNNFAQLLPDTARIRFVTALVPHHATAAQFLPLESKLDTGLTFRAWDQSAGAAGGFADTTSNGGSSAFSLATETVKVYFETRLFRVFNSNAQLNVYALEAEFNALTANPALQDRSTSAFTGFTILMSAVPELGTAPVFRMLYGVQFNADGTETDMGYRYLTTNEGEASFLEGLGRADKRPQRDGTYFREIGDPAIPSDPGVNNRTAILGYIFTTQQPGTQQMTQVYRLDDFPKPTRPGGTRAGSPTTTTVLQQQGDHVYTTNTAFETSRPGTWVVEANRGFVRELSPNPTGGPPPVSEPAVSQPAMVANEGPVVMVVPPPLFVAVTSSDSPVFVGASPVESVSRLIAVPMSSVGSGAVAAAAEESETESEIPWGVKTEEPEEETTYDTFFADAELVGASGWGV
jgi:hypothetical protein